MIGKKIRTLDGFSCIILDRKKSHVVYRCLENGGMKSDYISDVLDGYTNLLYYNFGILKANDPTDFYYLKNSKAWEKYISMLFRCYNGDCKAYENVIICDQWRDFLNFKKWFDQNYIKGFELDKDLFSNKDKKIYSPETCCFLPPKINNFIKAEPEAVLKTITDKYYYMQSINGEKKIIYFNTKADAIKSKRNYLKEKTIEKANRYKSQLTNKVYNKLISLY